MRTLYIPFVVILFFFSCQEHQEHKHITVFASESFKSSLPEINTKFSALYNIEVEVQFAEAHTLQQEIEKNKHIDVLLLDNQNTINTLVQNKYIEGEAKKLVDAVVVGWTWKNTELDDSLGILRSTDIATIGILNPQKSALGKISEMILFESNFSESVLKKVVYYNSQTEIVNALLSKKVDFIFMNKATVLSVDYTGKGFWSEINPNLGLPIEHLAAQVKHTTKKKQSEVQEYYNFLFSAEAASVFEKYGFTQEETFAQPIGLTAAF